MDFHVRFFGVFDSAEFLVVLLWGFERAALLGRRTL